MVRNLAPLQGTGSPLPTTTGYVLQGDFGALGLRLAFLPENRVNSACSLPRPSPGTDRTPSRERTCTYSPAGGRGDRLGVQTCSSEPTDLFLGEAGGRGGCRGR